MNNDYTPGPWHAVRDDDQQVIDITPHLPDENGELEKTIATVWGNRPSLKATVEGDARLIAAAPELLRGLVMMLGFFEGKVLEGEAGWDCMTAARQAIEKATGQEWKS